MHNYSTHQDDSHNAQQSANDHSPSEREQKEHQLPSHAAVIHEEIREQGTQELQRDAIALLLSAIAAGLSMGISLLAKGLLSMNLAGSEAAMLLSHFGYTLGFVVVIMAHQQLFTENTLTAVLPFMQRPNRKNLTLLIKLWVIVLLGNIFGAAIAALALQHWPIAMDGLHNILLNVSKEGVVHPAGTLFGGALVSGWLVATMVWMFPYAGSAKIFVIAIITWLMSAGGLAHIVMGSVEGFYLVLTGELSWQQFIWPFALPTLAGNIVGGTLIFALLSHAQIRNDLQSKAKHSA